MAIKVLIKRHLKDTDYKKASRMVINSRTLAMSQDGYISSETLWDADDPKTVMVESIWQSRESWDRYKGSDARQKQEKEFEGILSGPAEYETFKMGMQP